MLSSFFFHSPVPTARSRYGFALLIATAFFILAANPASAIVNESDPKKMLREGDRLMGRGKLVEAEDLYRKALAADPAKTAHKMTLAELEHLAPRIDWRASGGRECSLRLETPRTAAESSTASRRRGSTWRRCSWR